MRPRLFVLLAVALTTPSLFGDDLALTVNQFNAQFTTAWKDARIEPAGTVDDARYLRRIYLDIAGTLPPPEKIRAFLLDPSADKRSRAVDELLDSPEYAIRWSNYWNAVLMGRTIESAIIDQAGFKLWLKDEFAENTPWDQIVT